MSSPVQGSLQEGGEVVRILGCTRTSERWSGSERAACGAYAKAYQRETVRSGASCGGMELHPVSGRGLGPGGNAW